MKLTQLIENFVISNDEFEDYLIVLQNNSKQN